MRNQEKDQLVGMKEICEYAEFSKQTVVELVAEKRFPAAKIKGRWRSCRSSIDLWTKRQIEEETSIQ